MILISSAKEAYSKLATHTQLFRCSMCPRVTGSINIRCTVCSHAKPIMLFRMILDLQTECLFKCHGLPASVSEAHSSASQKLHLYIKNSTDGVNYQLSPIISQLRHTNEEVELGRNAILPYFSFLFDTLGDVEEEMEECLDDMEIQMIPDDPSDPGFPNIPTEPSVPIEPLVPTGAPSGDKPK